MNSSTNSLEHQFWREKTGKITILNLYMNQTQSLLVTENKKHEFWRELLSNQGIHSILRIHKSDPTETRKSRNWRSFGARMRSELDFITSVCCGGECDLKGCERRSSRNDIYKHKGC